MADYEDPGWMPVLRILLPAILFPPLRISRRHQRRERARLSNRLNGARAIFVGLLASPFLFAFVVFFEGFKEANGWSAPGRWGWVAVAFGGAAFLGLSLFRRRSLDGSDPSVLVGSWTGSLFIGIGLADLPMLIGLVLAFVSGKLWASIIGVAFTVVGLLLIAPSRRNIEARQAQLDASGSALSLGQLLTTPRPDSS